LTCEITAMRRLTLLYFSFVFCLNLLATESWDPKVSIQDRWRWTGLEFLNDYDIIYGTKGAKDEVWFVHQEGILHYDGIEVRNYPVPRLANQSIKDIHYLADGRILVTTDYELIVWQEDHSTAFKSPDASLFIRNGIAERPDGRVIVATQTGVFEVKREGLSKIETGHTKLNSVLIDTEGNLWIGETAGSIEVHTLTAIAGNLVASLLHRYDTSPANPFGPHLIMDSRGRVWVLDPDEKDQCYLYENYERKPAISGLRSRGLLSDAIRVIETTPGELWICSSRKLARWNGQELQVYGIEDYPIPSSYPYLIALSGDRILLGGQKLTPQLLNLSKQRWATFPGLNFECEGEAGILWFIAEDRRVLRYNGVSWEVFGAKDGVIDRPNRIIATSGGVIWASGSDHGQAAVALYRNGIWESHRFPEVGKTFSHLAALETKEGEVIFGGGTPESQLGSATGGAVVFRKTDQGYLGHHYPYPTFSKRTANLVERKGDGLLFSTASVFKAGSEDKYINTTKDLFSRQWIDHMIVDKKNDLWVACLGVGLYHNASGHWRLHGRKDGLDTKNIIYLLEEAGQGRILALTDKGFYQYDGVSWGKWGFPMDFSFTRENHTVFQSRDGAFWLNFSSRDWLLELKNFGQHNYDFQTIRYRPDSTAPKTWATIQHTRFPEGGQIQVRFEGADYWEETSRRDLVYSWSLDGSKWSPYSGETSVIFSALGSGDYRLAVRARDMSGNVDQTPAIVAFSVLPPLWRQWWFILSVVVVLVSICFLVYSLYQTRLRAALALDEFKLDFFTNISHELRTPLAVIISPMEMLLESELGDSARKKIHIVLRNARKMQGMIDQLLEFRKIEKGRWTLNHEGGEIIGFTKEAVMNHEPVWQSRNQTMAISVTRDAFLCSFDSSSLQKVIDNLVSNAIKYSGEQAALRVGVKIEAIDGHDHYILEVEDNGVGIPLHEQKNILQPFYRVRRNAHQEGSGVGLAFVNQLVGLWGGSVEIRSPLQQDGRGTRFTVNLPLEPYEEHGATETVSAAGELVGDGRPVVMFVEDNEDMRHILVDAFSENYRVIEAGDGEAGFELAQKLNPDLVVSDVMMPRMNGNELCEKLKTSPETSHIPVVLLTARSSSEHRLEGIRSGADDYIPKPLDMKHLTARIENLLESRRELKRKFAKQLVIEATDITVTPTDERIIAKAIKTVEDSMMDEDFNVDRFARLMGMSRSTLKRKLNAVTGLSPQPFIQQLRLKRAAKLLSSGGISVSEVARMVGFYDLSYFGSVFKKEFGSTPSHYAQHVKDMEATKL
jgi:signal transduction histidine kinase/DNA-binding response OmpR family regulator